MKRSHQRGVTRIELWSAVVAVGVIVPALQRSGVDAVGSAWAQVGSVGNRTSAQPTTTPNAQPGSFSEDVFNPARQRQMIVEELRSVNSRLQQVDNTLRSGSVRVRLEGDLPAKGD